APPPVRAPSARPPSDLATTTEGNAARAPESSATQRFVRKATDDDAPTRTRQRSELPSYRPPSEPDVEAPLPPVFEDEQPAHEHIGEEAREGASERARWFEEEARSMRDAGAAARALLAASELHAMCDNMDEAARLAVEARELDPRSPLAHWQARALLRGDTSGI